MFFKTDFTVTGLRLLPRDDSEAPEYPLVFDYGALRVELAPPTDAQERSGFSRETGVGTATLERTPPPKATMMFEALARGEFPERSTPEQESDYFDVATGRLVPGSAPPLDIMPPLFREFAYEVRNELWSFALRTVRVLRWRLDHEGPHNPFATRGDFWSFDGANWEVMPYETSLSMQQQWPLSLSEEALLDISTLVGAGRDEPLSHQLFREALLQRNENPRSALVIGVSAVEVAVKECVAALDPLATWLVQHLPTPPVVSILRDYIPTLPAENTINETVLPPPKDLLDELQKAVLWRNQVTHGGHLAVSADRVAKFLELTGHDIIWLLTYYAGAEWALDNVTNGTRVALDLPELDNVRRGRATVSVVRWPVL